MITYSPAGLFMGLARFSLSLFGAVAVIAATLAAATIWLLLTDPVTVADAVKDGQVTPLVRALAGVLYDAVKGILRYI
jgi:multidrug resistance efflux pump